MSLVNLLRYSHLFSLLYEAARQSTQDVVI